MFSYENHEHQHDHCTYNLDKEVNQLADCLGLSAAIEDLINKIEIKGENRCTVCFKMLTCLFTKLNLPGNQTYISR